MKPVNKNAIGIIPDKRRNRYKMSTGGSIIWDHRVNRAEYDVVSGIVESAPDTVTFIRYNPNKQAERKLDSRLKNLWGKDRFTWPCPLKKGDKVYFQHNMFDEAVRMGFFVEKEGSRIDMDDHEVELFYMDPAGGLFETTMYAYERDGNIQALFDNVLLTQVIEKEELSPGGIIINPYSLDAPVENQGVVVSVGESGTPWGFSDSEVSVGDTVIYDENCNVEITINETKYLIMSKDDILAVLS